MELTVERHAPALAKPFGISRGEQTTADVVLVELRAEAGTAGDRPVTGLGGVGPSSYYGESADSVVEALERVGPAVEDCEDPHARQRLLTAARERIPAAPAARAALSTALADLAARDLGVPLYRLWGLDPEAAPSTSYTVGLADPGRMAERASTAADRGFPVLKVKLGGGDGRDRERLRAVRAAAPDATLRVDANGAWSVERALSTAEDLVAAGVEFLEQPVPGDDRDALRAVHREAPLPIAADEACVDATEVPAVADACDLVVVKLPKCGGIGAARAQLRAARAHGLDAMLGCFVASWAALAPACHLAPRFDHVDLDGALLLAEGADPCTGLDVERGRFDLAVGAGSGARRR